MRCLLLAALAPLPLALAIDDSSELVQSSARVQDPPRAIRRVSAALERAQQALEDRVSRLAQEAVRDVLKEHVVATQAPSPAKDEAETKAPKQRKGGGAASSEPKEETAEDLKRHVKYGEDVTLTLRLPGGEEMASGFHSATRMQALMHSACKKLGTVYEDTKFSFGGQELDPLLTPEEFGLSDRDVVEVDSPILRERAALAAEAKGKAAEAAEQRKAAEAVAQRAAAEKQETKRRAEQKAGLEQAEKQRKHELKEQGRVTLAFVHESGNVKRERVQIAAPEELWLQGTLKLVCKRLAVDCDSARFLRQGGKVLSPHDTARALGLKEMEEIVVKTPIAAAP